MQQPKALVVDDEKSICQSVEGVLMDEGWDCTLANSGAEALKIVAGATKSFDLAILDVWMPGIDGIETLQRLKEKHPNLPVVIMSGHGTIETAVRATKLGAFDFLEKPLSLEKLVAVLERVQAAGELPEPGDLPKMPDLIGESSEISMVKRQIKLVAPRNSWVLITGENGTGKEIVARNIHRHSQRSKFPFVAVNCAAIPEDLIESELFGHAKGAFTSAVSAKRGRFELAHKGTLFLDEIGDMSLKTQAKILRILQEQSFERIGDTSSIQVDVRVVAATNKSLEEEIKNGNFREDLFFRLNVIPIKMNPLRDRIVDIPDLARHFLHLMAKELNEPAKTISAGAMARLMAYQWPGNIRELKNLIERLCILNSGNIIDVADLPEHLVDSLDQDGKVGQDAGNEGKPDRRTLREAKSMFEKTYILDKLEKNQWNVSRTAEALGIERSHLHRKLRTYQINLKSHKGDAS